MSIAPVSIGVRLVASVSVARWLVGAVLVAYSGVGVALPLQLGITHSLPVGARWWLLPLMWACFAVLAFGAERVTGGNAFGTLAVSAVVVVALAGAAMVGLTSGFVLLVVPLLAALMWWQAVWGFVLHRLSAPAWLIALTGSLVVAWPIAAALPVSG